MSTLSSILSGPRSSLVYMTLAGLVMPVVFLALNLWKKWRKENFEPRTDDSGAIESSAAYRRFLVAAAGAGGSEQAWDHHVRPVLAELAQVAIANGQPLDIEVRQAVRRHLGDAFWPLVNPDGPRSHDRTRQGPSRATMLRILDRIEAPADPRGMPGQRNASDGPCGGSCLPGREDVAERGPRRRSV